MKADQLKQIEFIKSELRLGKERIDILQKFTKVYKSSIKTFDNRLKIARIAILDEVKDIQSKTKDIVEAESNKAALEILSVAERIHLLVKMAKGDMDIEQETTTKDGIVTLIVKPSHSERRAAIAELNKMAGDYAAAKSEVKLIGEQPLFNV